MIRLRCVARPLGRSRLPWCRIVRYRCAPGDGWASTFRPAGRTLAELLVCARPCCKRRVAPARPETPAAVAALCRACRTQYAVLRSRGIQYQEALRLVLRPLRTCRGQPRKECAA